MVKSARNGSNFSCCNGGQYLIARGFLHKFIYNKFNNYYNLLLLYFIYAYLIRAN